MTNTYTTETDPLGSFIVYQDGALDEARAEQYDKTVRRDYLKAYAAEKALKMAQMGYKVLRGVGSATLQLFDACAEASKQADTAK